MLRRILRRAVRHAWLLGRREPTLAPLTDVVVRQMGDVYPELARQGRLHPRGHRDRGARFLETIEGGLRAAGGDLRRRARARSRARRRSSCTTRSASRSTSPQIIAEERGVEVDTRGLRAGARGAADAARATARTSGQDRPAAPGGAHRPRPASGAASSAASRSSSATRPPRPTPTCSPSGRRDRGWSWCCARTRSTPSRAGR